MKGKGFQNKRSLALGMAVLLSLVWIGCSTVERKGEAPMAMDSTGAGKYYFFDDVLIPKELNYKASRSVVYETPKFKAGSMFFSAWWVDTDFLIGFFTDHMQKDNWKLVNSFREKKETILNFSKPDKMCTIRIVDSWYGSVDVEIRIGPVA